MRLLQGNTVLVLLYVCEWQASTTSPSNSVGFHEFSVLVEWMDLRWAWTGETGVDVSHWNWRIESDPTYKLSNVLGRCARSELAVP